MRRRLILIVFMLISVSCFARQGYSLSKADFTTQFTDSNSSGLVYCYNEKGEKVWLKYNKNSQLLLKMNNNKEKVLMLHTVRYNNEKIDAIEYNVWLPSNKVSSFNIADVQSFTIDRKYYEYEFPYFNIDETKQLVAFKNDSLVKEYSTGSEWIIILKEKGKVKGDSIAIVTNACYNIDFKSDKRIFQGVVMKITQDSFFVSSSFNEATAVAEKIEYSIRRYAIGDISGLRLLKSGGHSYRNVRVEDYDVDVKKVDKASLLCPFWYSISPTAGIKFYRVWPTDNNFPGITEIKGKTIWYEGERIH